MNDDDDFDVTAGDGLVELNIGKGYCDHVFSLTPSEAERIGCALLRAAGVADWKATDDDESDEAGTPFVVTDCGNLPF